MTLSTDWQQAYDKLIDFTATRPEIKIEKSGVSIPRECREDFYRWFDTLRRTFVEDNYASLPTAVGTLSEHYLQAAKEVRELMSLDSITMPVDLLSFLESPKEGLMRPLYNRLFDLLQGKISPETFDVQATNELKASSADLLRLGYQTWVALAVIKILDPDRGFMVELDADDKTIPTELRQISFGRQTPHVSLRLPEFFVYSRRIGKFVSVKSQLAAEIITYSPTFMQPHGKRRRTGDTSYALDTRVLLLSVMPSEAAIPVLVDFDKQTLSSPDLAIECTDRLELADPAVSAQVGARHSILRPVLGTYLVSIDGVPEMNIIPPEENVHPIAVGFDESKLQPLAERLAGIEPARA